jgi:hypothetical protein
MCKYKNKKMKFYILFFFVLSITLNASCQNAFQDKPNENVKYVSKAVTLLRLGLGYQKSLYSELGFTRRNYFGDDIVKGCTAYYGSVEWTPEFSRESPDVYGIKFGGEITLQPLMVGIESKFQSNFNDNDFVITPKIGIGDGNFTRLPISYIYLCYGYNISFNHRPFGAMGRNQISLVFNPVNISYLLNKKRYKKKSPQ